MLRLLICAGGTGGGVYPALSVLQALGQNKQTEISVLWVGGEGGMEADLVQRMKVPFTTIPAAGVHGVGLRALPGNSIRLVRGALASRRILNQFRPDVLLFTGGYVAVPMALAGRGLPTLLYVPDIEPGLALKTLARFATRIAVTAEASRAFFNRPQRVVVTGYPTRPDLTAWQRSEARYHLGLQPDQLVLLVFGGSKGARSINRALFAHLPRFLQEAQIIHISGQLDWAEVEAARARLTPEQAARYHAFPYLHEEMGAALAAADLVVSRAGASSLGEFPLFGLPAVLVPYPYAWRYQKVNAAYLVDQNAAVMLPDAQMGNQLYPLVRDLLNDPARLHSMRAQMQALAQPKAALTLAHHVLELARSSHPEANPS